MSNEYNRESPFTKARGTRKDKMIDDLINREEVISLIDELGYVNCRNTDDFKANSRMDKIRQSVVELPTAFNKGKVIEELRKEAMHELGIPEGKFDSDEGEYSSYCSISFSQEKRIVEKGVR